MYCSKCGKTIADEASFCMYCGQPQQAGLSAPTKRPEGDVARLFATTYDLCQWPAEQVGVRALRRRAVADLPGRVLELGAGTGLNFPFYEAATEVVAVEPDPDMRVRAAARARVAHVPIHLVDAQAEQLPFADDSFDAAAITLVLCSVSDVTQALAELRRVLRPRAVA